MADRKPSASARRRAARLHAVQALYNIDRTGQSTESVLGEFVRFRLGAEVDGDEYVDPDRPLFAAIVRGVESRQSDLNAIIDGALDKGMSSDRLELLLRLIVRAGTWELLAAPDTAAPIVIADYVDLAHAFYAGKEPGIANAVLDRIARTLRPDELGAVADGAAG
ncbi:MAG: transcription antitermination factor NusB [Pseudomonadota bacterium]